MKDFVIPSVPSVEGNLNWFEETLMGDKSIRRVAHVLPDMMPFLSGTFARLILRHFPNATIFLQSYFVWGSEAVAREKNAVWTKELPNCAYLSRSLACKRLNRFQGKMHSFVSLFVSALALCGMMAGVILPIAWLPLPGWGRLLLQVPLGVIVYFFAAWLFRLAPLCEIARIASPFIETRLPKRMQTSCYLVVTRLK